MDFYTNEQLNDIPLDISWYDEIMNDVGETETETIESEIQHTKTKNVPVKPLLKLRLWDKNTGEIYRSFKIVNMKIGKY